MTSRMAGRALAATDLPARVQQTNIKPSPTPHLGKGGRGGGGDAEEIDKRSVWRIQRREGRKGGRGRVLPNSTTKDPLKCLQIRDGGGGAKELWILSKLH